MLSLCFVYTCIHFWASLVAQPVKKQTAVQETPVRFLGWEDPLEKGTATHSSVLAWRIPRTEKPGGLQSMGSQRVGQDWATFTYLHIHFYFDWIQEIRLKIISGELFFSHVKTGICKNTTEETNYLLDYNVNKLLESEGFLRVSLAEFASKLKKKKKKKKLGRENIYRWRKKCLTFSANVS